MSDFTQIIRQRPPFWYRSIEKIEGVENNFLYHAAMGGFLNKHNQLEAAMLHDEKALGLVSLPAERRILAKKSPKLRCK